MNERGWDGTERRAPDCRQSLNCPHIDTAVHQAIKDVFAILGVNVDDPKQVEEFREDLRFGGKLRKVADHSLLALFGVIAAAFAAAVWAGISSKLNGH